MISKGEIKNSVVKRLLIIMAGFVVLNSYTAEANSQIGNIFPRTFSVNLGEKLKIQ